jgi:hypothetical protein
MSGRLGGISGEISAGGFRPNARHNSTSEEADAVRREVGSVHSSVEGRSETGAKGPNLIDGNSEAWDEAMAPATGIRNANQSSTASTNSLPQGEGCPPIAAR